MKSTARNHRAVGLIWAAWGALAGVLVLAAMPAAWADSTVAQQVTRALNQARSYEAVMDIKETGADVSPAESSFHVDEIVIRNGADTVMYTRMKVEGQTVEMEMKGNKICQGVAGHWQCDSMGPQSGALLKMTPEQMLKSLGVHVVYKPAGTRTIAGQRAVGYTFASTSSVGTSQGTFWLDPSGQRVIEMDTVTTTKVMGKTSGMSMKAVFSHWNDPNLKVPPVPGL